MNNRKDLDDMKNAMQDMVDSFDVLSKSIYGSYHCFVDLGNDLREELEELERLRKRKKILLIRLIVLIVIFIICISYFIWHRSI